MNFTNHEGENISEKNTVQYKCPKDFKYIYIYIYINTCINTEFNMRLSRKHESKYDISLLMKYSYLYLCSYLGIWDSYSVLCL